MIRRAFVMRLKPGMLDEYRELHDNIWPELVREIEASGIASMTIFEDAPLMFVFSEIRDAEAFDRLWASEIHQRWGQEIQRCLDFDDEGQVDTTELTLVFNLETEA
jgi:L-rhamnose mutarotase